MSNQRMTGSWGASLPRQPVQPGRGAGSSSDLVQPSGKQPPVVPKVQHDLVAHLQRAFPILEPSIVQLIVDESGEGGISDAVKTLSSLAVDAETEAASSSSHHGSTDPIVKRLGSPSSNCVDDKVAMDMAIAASLADQKVQRSVSNVNLQVETADSGCWDAESGWETIDPAVAAEWGAPPPLQSNPMLTGSGLDAWEDVPVQSTAPRGVDMPPVQSEGALVASWGTDWTRPVEAPSHEGSPKPLVGEEEAAKEPGAQAMAAILGENWAKEPLWSSSAGCGDSAIENRDPALGRPTVQAVKGKTKVRPYAPRIATGAGKEESKRPYSPKVLIDRIDLGTNAVAAHYPLKESLSRETVLETFEAIRRDLPEDGEAEVFRQLKAMFPEVADSVICKAYIDSDSDANRAAEALFQSKEDTFDTSESTAALEGCSSSCKGKPPSSGKPDTRLEASVQDDLLHAKSANSDAGLKHNLVPSRQHPNPFTEDESDSEHATGSQSQLVSPLTATSSSHGMSPLSSAVTSPATSPRSRKKGKKDGRRVTAITSSSSSSDEEAKNTRRDMVDFMVSMLGGSVPVSVVADVIENLKGDFQQSMKCLLSMSAGSEGGLIGEEFGAMTDGSDGAGELFESPSRPSSDGGEEDPATTLANIFGTEKKETIQQVLKEKGGNVGDAATVLMAMFESETGASSGDDLLRSQHVEDEPVVEEVDSEEPTVKINVEQLMAHFPLADESAVWSLLHINNNSFEDTAKMLYDSGLMPRGLDVASLSDHEVAQPTYADRRHFSQHQLSQNGSLVAGTRARPVTPPYGSGTRPPGGYYEEPSFHQPRAHLQPLFRADEFPEIGREMPAFGAAPDERAPVHDGHNSLFLKNRSATNKHWRACQYYFAEAARARANREFSRAEALKEQGRKHKRLAEAANQVASSKIFSEKNKTIRNSVKIDVHGQLVQEALGHVDDHLKSLSNLTTISYLSIITGRGLHSENGKAKILPAVQKYLRDRGYTFYQENPGCIVVDLKAERQVPNSLSSAEDADSRPSSAESYEERPGRLEGAGNGQASYRKLNLA